MKRLFAFSMIATLASGCGNFGSKDQPSALTTSFQPDVVTPVAEDKSEKPAEAGEFVKTIETHRTSALLGACDQKFSTIQKEIAVALDARKDEIKAYLATNPAGKNERAVPFGSSTLLEYTGKIKSFPDWRSSDHSWNQIQEKYALAKDQQINQDWIDLNDLVRSILTDDKKRLVNKVNFQLDRDSGPLVKELFRLVSTCEKNMKCTSLELSDELKIFIRKNSFYTHLVDHLAKATSFTDSRDTIKIFFERMSADYDRYRFIKNKTVTLTTDANGKEIVHLPLDGDSLDDQQKKVFQDAVEKVWKSDTRELSISWEQSRSIPGLFKFFFDATKPGARPYSIRQKTYEIHLFPENYLHSLAHETGHVIGLPDHYYTRWDENECKYVDQKLDRDIMSVSLKGSATDEDWQEISENYRNTRVRIK